MLTNNNRFSRRFSFANMETNWIICSTSLNVLQYLYTMYIMSGTCYIFVISGSFKAKKTISQRFHFWLKFIKIMIKTNYIRS